MATRGTPPRFVPTLTEVVQARAPVVPADPVLLEEQIVQRVMQRIDLSLERKLREAIATVVLENTRALTPKLREHIETVVRTAVTQAVAEEMESQQQVPPPRA
jgi:DNA helicase TIP49 (TBP-interacting protein)